MSAQVQLCIFSLLFLNIWKIDVSLMTKFLSPYLCGFRKGYDAQYALLRLKNHLDKSLDKREKIGLFTMNLSKAFDCILQDLLISKSCAYGLDKISLIYL